MSAPTTATATSAAAMDLTSDHVTGDTLPDSQWDEGKEADKLEKLEESVAREFDAFHVQRKEVARLDEERSQKRSKKE